jgi:hypothetical protein
VTFYLVLFGIITAFSVGIVFLDWLGRRQEKRRQSLGR